MRRWQLSAIFRQKPTFSKRPHCGHSWRHLKTPKLDIHSRPIATYVYPATSAGATFHCSVYPKIHLGCIERSFGNQPAWPHQTPFSHFGLPGMGLTKQILALRRVDANKQIAILLRRNNHFLIKQERQTAEHLNFANRTSVPQSGADMTAQERLGKWERISIRGRLPCHVSPFRIGQENRIQCQAEQRQHSCRCPDHSPADITRHSDAMCDPANQVSSDDKCQRQ